MTNYSNKKKFALIAACIGGAALICEYTLLLSSHPELSFFQKSVKYFSFFTVLTNSLVAVYFAYQALKKEGTMGWFDKPGILTAITVYITVVGLVYNLVLRKIDPSEGLARVNTEIFHCIMPLLVIMFWLLYEKKGVTPYRSVSQWILYPLIYAVYTLIHGDFAGYYPYPFVDVNALGLPRVLLNMAVLLVIFLVFSLGYLRLGKFLHIRQQSKR